MMPQSTANSLASPIIDRIEPSTLAALLEKTPEDVAVLDVRRSEAWGVDPARIPSALWLPIDSLDRHAREIPRRSQLVVYCS